MTTGSSAPLKRKRMLLWRNPYMEWPLHHLCINYHIIVRKHGWNSGRMSNFIREWGKIVNRFLSQLLIATDFCLWRGIKSVVVPWQQTFVCSANLHEKFITAKTRIAPRQATCTICAKFVVLFKPDESRGMVYCYLVIVTHVWNTFPCNFWCDKLLLDKLCFHGLS